MSGKYILLHHTPQNSANLSQVQIESSRSAIRVLIILFIVHWMSLPTYAWQTHHENFAKFQFVICILMCHTLSLLHQLFYIQRYKIIELVISTHAIAINQALIFHLNILFYVLDGYPNLSLEPAILNLFINLRFIKLDLNVWYQFSQQKCFKIYYIKYNVSL